MTDLIKNKFFLLVIILIAIDISIRAQSFQVPNSIKSKYQPPNFPVRAMAEWEEIEAVMMSWGDFSSVHHPDIYNDLAGIINEIQKEVKIFLLCTDPVHVQRELIHRNIPLKNIVFIRVEKIQTPWCRDYGPLSVYSTKDLSLNLIDWIYDQPHEFDDKLPTYIAFTFNIPIYKTIIPPYTLIFNGANLLVDGHGTGIINKYYRVFQPERKSEEYFNIFKNFMGLNRIIELDLSYRHLDAYFKLLDEETLLVEEPQHPILAKTERTEKNLQFILSNFTTCFGRPFKVVRIPVPDISNFNSSITFNEDNYPNYINSLILNKTVLVPTYQSATDSVAINIYRKAMPGYRIVGVDCSNLIIRNGALHCVTREIGSRDPIFISHPALQDQPYKANGYEIQAYVQSFSGISQVHLFWKHSSSKEFKPLPMKKISENIYKVVIPPQAPGTHIYYFIEAINKNGKRITKPLVAPKGCWHFKIIQSPKKLSLQKNLGIEN